MSRDQTPRYRIVCDLNEQEYQEQAALAQADPHRRPPLVEFQSDSGAWTGEAHIGRIIADALASSRDEEMSDASQAAVEDAVSRWPLQDKTNFVRSAMLHWLPPQQDEPSCWNGTPSQASAFLQENPAVLELIAAHHDPEHNPEPLDVPLILGYRNLIRAMELNRAVCRRTRNDDDGDSAEADIAPMALEILDHLAGTEPHRPAPRLQDVTALTRNWEKATQDILDGLGLTIVQDGPLEPFDLVRKDGTIYSP